MHEKIWLSVPFEEKDDAKKLGAMWNKTAKRWFIFDDMESARFAKWIPAAPKFSLRARSFLIIKGAEHCWKCHQACDVYAFCLPASEEMKYDEDGQEYWSAIPGVATVCDITSLSRHPESVMTHISKGKLRKDHSHTVGGEYFMNHCQHCDAKLGDHFLFGEPGGAFFPEEGRPVAQVVARYADEFLADASYTLSTASVI